MKEFLVKTKEFFKDFNDVTRSGCIKRLVLYVIGSVIVWIVGYKVSGKLGYEIGLEINTIRSLKGDENAD